MGMLVDECREGVKLGTFNVDFEDVDETVT
jgi:hypothetical protein